MVLSVKLSLVESDRDVTRKRRQEMLELRRRRQPLRYASAGSVFRNPSSESPAGMLIEQAGLKGYRIGGAEISQLHANWIINREKNASAADVRGLMDLCRRRVRDMTNISLEPEIVLW